MLSRDLLKKAVLLIAIAILSVAMLTACGSSEKPSTEPETPADGASSEAAEEPAAANEEAMTLRFAWWGNQIRNDRTIAALAKYTELNPNVKTEGTFYQWTDYWSKMATQAAGNEMPDLIQMDLAYIDQYTKSEQLLDLTPYIESGALDVSKIDANIQTMGKVGEGIYGIPAGINVQGMFYDKAIAEAAGVEVKDNMTLDEFIEIAKIVAEKTGYKAKLFYDVSYMREWSRANDVSIQEAKMPADSYEAYIPFFQIQADGIKDGWHVTPDIMQGNSIETEPLIYGESPETMSWTTINGGCNQLTVLQAAAKEGQKISVTTIPTNDPKKSNFLKPAMFFSVSSSTKNPDAAVALLNYLINSVEANDILLGERGVPVNSEIADYLYEKITPGEQEIYHFVNDVVAPNCSPIDPPDPTGWSELRTVLQTLVEKVGYGQITPEEAAKEYFTKGTEIFAANAE